MYKIRGTYQESMDTLYNTKTVTGAISRTGITHAHLCIWRARAMLLLKSKTHFGNRKNLARLSRRMGQSQRQKRRQLLSTKRRGTLVFSSFKFQKHHKNTTIKTQRQKHPSQNKTQIQIHKRNRKQREPNQHNKNQKRLT